MISYLKSKISNTNPIRLFYHKIKAILACLINNFPSSSMTVIGITGTNGKTTTANMVSDILKEDGKENILISTTKFRIGDESHENLTKMTFPSPFKIQKMLKEAKEKGIKYAVIEVTSHAIAQSRIWGINFDIVCFTNITHDHFDYHGSFMSYKEAKGELFRRLMYSKRKKNQKKISVLNIESDEFEFFDSFPADKKVIFGINKGEVSVKDLKMEPRFSSFKIKIPNEEIKVKLPMPARFNVENAVAATAITINLGIDLKTIKNSIESISVQNVPGRFEFIELGQKFACIVDFAHTPDALEKLLKTFNETLEFRSGNSCLVFGCTGERDKDKRMIMGEIADKYADKIILTSDDPYSEDPFEILKEIEKGVQRDEGKNFWIIEDRKKAIEIAITEAKDTDIIILAGKGAEKFQVVGKEKLPHDDREVASRYIKEALKSRKGKKSVFDKISDEIDEIKKRGLFKFKKMKD